MHYSLTQLLDMSTHTAPKLPPPLYQAHELMRLHRQCTVESCPRKRAAFEVLVEAGRIVPDSSRRH
ncbi:hypothetical protein [Nocardia pseudobrasiliensis]|uniref:Uncharacterized protein n=1 Tax=Nocardia pseudobrasiliensis TaxID=45979 RepID=A0A370I1R5_9NOCA|nr:hypothetical protein [Nocardia pseudobrasiliensis]RDI63214.1 hypothetical protein DFR76_111233 [Nocardia pseudobrasiliensis]